MELSEQNIEKMLEDIPTFSRSVVRILELTADINSSTKDLVEQITNDPILTAKVLKLVNSAYFGLSREVSSIQQSIVYVGINTIKNLALTVAAIGSLPDKNSAGLNMSHYWLHSLVTASVAKLVAQNRKVPQKDISNYFISGLLHDIGQIIFSHAQPEAYKQILEEAKLGEKSLFELEEEVFGINHARIGAMLARKWQLPGDMVIAISEHHNPDCTEGDESLNKIIFIANQLARNLEDEETRISRLEDLPENCQQWLGQSLETLAESLTNLEQEIDNARVFIQVPGQ